MRVTVYNTDTQNAICYYDVEAILFDRQNNAELVFYTGERKRWNADEYTDIDCKKAVMTR